MLKDNIYNMQIKIIAICIMLVMIGSSFVTTVSSDKIIEGGGQVQNNSREFGSNQTFDFRFGLIGMINNLANVVTEDGGIYWTGREYGTNGERHAADIIENYWNNYIAGKNNIGVASRERVYKPLSPDINDKTGVHSKDDFSLNILGKTVSYGDCFPVLTSLHEKVYDFKDAVVHLTPEEIYEYLARDCSEEAAKEQSCGGEDLGYLGEMFAGDILNNSPTGEKNIYLIEFKKFREYNLSLLGNYSKIIQKLTSYTLVHPPFMNAFLFADINDDTYFMGETSSIIPGMMINGSLGTQIRENISSGVTVTVDFYIHQYYDRNVESYNIIGTIPGKSDKTIVLCAHYDSWWNHCVVDNAASVAIILGIARHFSYYNLLPNYTMKFVAFSGEEFYARGARHYKWLHTGLFGEDIEYVINLDTIAYKNNSECPKENLSFNIWHYPYDDELNDIFGSIAEESDYETRSGGYSIAIKGREAGGVNMSDGAFFTDVALRTVISFDKGKPALADHFYHRDGEGHTRGDVMEVLDRDDLFVTAEIILNIVLSLSEENGDSGEIVSNQESVYSQYVRLDNFGQEMVGQQSKI